MKDPALELKLWLNQERDDGQEVNISNFRSLGIGFIRVLSSCYSIENHFSTLSLLNTHIHVNEYIGV